MPLSTSWLQAGDKRKFEDCPNSIGTCCCACLLVLCCGNHWLTLYLPGDSSQLVFLVLSLSLS